MDDKVYSALISTECEQQHMAHLTYADTMVAEHWANPENLVFMSQHRSSSSLYWATFFQGVAFTRGQYNDR